PDPDSQLARWAELGGYPWATDLEALTAVVSDAVAVGESSPRRSEALALARALGSRCSVFGPLPLPSPSPDPLERLDAALESLLGATSEDARESRFWQPARDAGFVAGAFFVGGEEMTAVQRFGDPSSLEWLAPLARHARQAPRGWAQMAVAEGGLWRAWCAQASEGSRDEVLAMGGRLLPALGYGSPGGRGQESARDRRLAERLLLDAQRTAPR
ncbi:MAG: hypothetical protein R3190_12050, partial [Thermoanaerobaculia bacterium]|nr:hypothetical protein [Thermoanaerobaculia bacterium]